MKYWKPEQLNKEQVKDIISEFGIPSIVAMLLSIRGINKYEDINSFCTKTKSLMTRFAY